MWAGGLTWMGVAATLATLAALASSTTYPDYKAAVVEYHPDWDPHQLPLANVQTNLNNFIALMKEAASQGAKIIVFPEIALSFFDKTVYISVPDPKDKVVPYTDTTQNEILQKLSKAAADYAIYTLVNLHEIYSKANVGVFYYNTNVVFDSKGMVVGRYRKFNLFNEKLNRTKTPDYSYFDTEWGGRFGTFTCFDILFEEPALTLVTKYNVTNVLYPTAWFSELPFLLAVQEQAAWAHQADVVLLAAGLNYPSIGSTGSGIYRGKDGPLKYTFTQVAGSKLILAQVGSATSYRPSPPLPDTNQSLKLKTEDLRAYNTSLLNPSCETKVVEKKGEGLYRVDCNGTVTETICMSGLCCDFAVEMTEVWMSESLVPSYNASELPGDVMALGRWRLAVLDGVRDFDGAGTGGIQTCALISCLDDSLETCGLRADLRPLPPRLKHHDSDLGELVLSHTEFLKVTIKGSFLATHSSILPNLVVTSPFSGTPLKGFNRTSQFGALPSTKDWVFELSPGGADLQDARLSLKHRFPITVAIHSRVFTRDGQPVTSASSSLTFYLLSIVTALLLLLVLRFKD